MAWSGTADLRVDVVAAVRSRSWLARMPTPSDLCETRPVVPTVVIIDDSDDFLTSAAGMLNEEGFRVVGCLADPTFAVAEVRRLRPSVVLLDIQLPTTDGFELAEALAKIEPRPVVVLISSRDAGAYGVLLRNAPVRGFIAKGDLNGETLGTMV
jgi:two-component system, NarL family, nitrate/nitrite response regulator NarL